MKYHERMKMWTLWHKLYDNMSKGLCCKGPFSYYCYHWAQINVGCAMLTFINSSIFSPMYLPLLSLVYGPRIFSTMSIPRHGGIGPSNMARLKYYVMAWLGNALAFRGTTTMLNYRVGPSTSFACWRRNHEETCGVGMIPFRFLCKSEPFHIR